MAIDPDADRLGLMLRDYQGRFRLLTGSQIEAILVDYVLASRKAGGTLPANEADIKTIATSNMIAQRSREFGVTLLDVRICFKDIGDLI